MNDGFLFPLKHLSLKFLAALDHTWSILSANSFLHQMLLLGAGQENPWREAPCAEIERQAADGSQTHQVLLRQPYTAVSSFPIRRKCINQGVRRTSLP